MKAHTIPRELRANNDYAADPATFERATTPVLLLMGSDSLPRRRELFTTIATKIPNARLVELAGQGTPRTRPRPGTTGCYRLTVAFDSAQVLAASFDLR